jgi:hypothetical protein
MNRNVFAFVLLAGLAVLAACGGRTAAGPSLLPGALGRSGAAARVAHPIAHAPCVFESGLRRPVALSAPVAIAFGQLMVASDSSRYAYPGVAFAYRAGKSIYAATRGRATYLPNQAGVGPSIVVAGAGGMQTLYAGFARPVHQLLKGSINVKAGQVVAVAGRGNVRFEYAPSGNVLEPGTQANPCGSGNNGANGSASVLPQNVAVYARFHALSLDATPLPTGAYPSASPDVATPAQLAVASVTTGHTLSPAVYERSDTWSSYYVVLCGNVVFATGPARYAGPFPYPSPTASSAPPLVVPSPLPKLVFFRDPGTQGSSLVAPLPSPYPRGCPAPPPADVYQLSSQTFYQVGQTEFLWYWCSVQPDTLTLTPSNAGVVSVTPTSLPAFGSPPPPNWPPPSPRADLTATGVGSATIAVSDPGCSGSDGTIDVTVMATPTPAPVPTVMPNT